jgi:hypothetical protein
VKHRDKLEHERFIGSRAEGFYVEFVQPFVEEKKQVIFEAFEATEATNVEQLAELRRMIGVLKAFENEITQYMYTGKMATLQLNEDNDGID